MTLNRLAYYSLVALLIVVFFLAWTAVPEPDLAGLR